MQDIHFYRALDENGNTLNYINNIVPEDRHPPAETAVLKCSVELKGLVVHGWLWGDNLIVIGEDHTNSYIYSRQATTEEVDEPFFEVEPIEGEVARTKKVTREDRQYYWQGGGRVRTYQEIDSYDPRYYNYYHYRNVDTILVPYAYLKVRVKCGGKSEDAELRFCRPNAGKVTLRHGTPHVEAEVFGMAYEWDVPLIDRHGSGHEQDGWHNLWNLLTHYEIDDVDALWNAFFDDQPTGGEKGIKSVKNRKDIKPNLDRLEKEEPLLFRFLSWLQDDKVREGVSNNQLVAAFLKKDGVDYDKLVAGLRAAMLVDKSDEPGGYYHEADWGLHHRNLCYKLPEAVEQFNEKKAKKDWSYRKGNKAKAEGLGIDPSKHKKLFAAIEEGKIPFSVFHDSAEKTHLINTEFDLWEDAFARGWGDTLCEIAQSAGGRKQYSRAVTPFISFLPRLEEYLNRNTPKRGPKGSKLPQWKCVPKFVQSQWELEMDEATEEGTSKRRSALTPIVDNETRTVEVPYVSMAVQGYSTTYCYSHLYQVFEANTIDLQSSSPVVNELEKGLNGRDDYGMMYYTLTGSAMNQGYPAFLIIFERLGSYRTRVHFHRVHPCRSKNGVPTPANRLIQEGYRYMAGNIRAEEIFAQQGDLIFIQNTTQTFDWDAEGQSVKDFESHAFVPTGGAPIKLVQNTAKSVKNRLGFIRCESSFMVDHPEHDPIQDMPAGVYEVRRCKSWEANPTAVWSLIID